MATVSFSERMLGRMGRLRSLRSEPGSTTWYFRRDRIATASLIVIIILILLAAFAPVVSPYPEEGAGQPNIVNKLLPPSAEHLFGTDPLGRDILSRVLYGARTALVAGITIEVLAVVLGSVLGALAGYFGGKVDEVIMRITDIFLAFPPLLLAMTIAAVLEPSLQNSILAITVVWWPWYTRIVRGQAVSVRERDYVRAARGMGVSDLTIIRRHILPNVMSPVMVQATLDLGAAILTVAALSFVGLGVPPPTADWGSMVSEGRIYVQNGRWWVPTFPGLALFITIMAFNLLGDGIQVITNPKTRGESQ
jgi:peptide/nickel transport system permease protein